MNDRQYLEVYQEIWKAGWNAAWKAAQDALNVQLSGGVLPQSGQPGLAQRAFDFERPIQFGGCPFCGRQNCIAGQCRIEAPTSSPFAVLGPVEALDSPAPSDGLVLSSGPLTQQMLHWPEADRQALISVLQKHGLVKSAPGVQDNAYPAGASGQAGN